MVVESPVRSKIRMLKNRFKRGLMLLRDRALEFTCCLVCNCISIHLLYFCTCLLGGKILRRRLVLPETSYPTCILSSCLLSLFLLCSSN